MSAKQLFIGLLCILLILPFASAHSNVLVDVTLDFDPKMKEQVVKKAAEFSSIKEKPIRFDYMFENVVVVYNRSLENSVHINPVTMQVFGFRDDSLAKSPKGDEQFNSGQRTAIAQRLFGSIPPSYQEELVYFGEKKGYNGVYRHLWVRLIDGVLVSNEMMEVEINPVSGKVTSWRLTPFMHPKEDFITTPGFSAGVSEQIALQFFVGSDLIDGEKPKLILEDQKPVWVVKVKAIYPFYIVIDAMDGRVKYSGIPKTEIPSSYTSGKERPVVVTEDVKRALL